MKLVWILSFLSAALISTAAAGQTAQDIIRKLEPIPGIAPKPIQRDPFGAPILRGVSTSGEEFDGPPSIDLRIPFEFNSDRLSADAYLILRNLAAALKDPRLSAFGFLIAGHTDAKGSLEYNQMLSERRAAAVRDYLVYQADVEASRIEAVGFGKKMLAEPARPEDAVNRRVQILNAGKK